MPLVKTITLRRKLPDEDLVLAEGQIDLWVEHLDDASHLGAAAHNLLSPEEFARASRFICDKHRRRYIALRIMQRRILSHYARIRPERLEFGRGRYGKPFLIQRCNNAPLHFSISRNSGVALLAITGIGEIGVDIEKILDLHDRDAIAERFFSPRERDVYDSLPFDAKNTAFFRCWTRKEALLKAMGAGLMTPPEKVDVRLDRGPSSSGSIAVRDPETETRWILQDIEVVDGFASALALRNGPVEPFVRIRNAIEGNRISSSTDCGRSRSQAQRITSVYAATGRAVSVDPREKGGKCR